MAADYTSTSASDRLAAVREAIADCLAAQSYTQRNRGVQRAQLRDLFALEQQLMHMAQEEGTSMASVGQINRPT